MVVKGNRIPGNSCYMLAVHALIIRNKYTPENLIWMPNVAILQRNQPLSNHFQTNLRSIYPNLSK